MKIQFYRLALLCCVASLSYIAIAQDFTVEIVSNSNGERLVDGWLLWNADPTTLYEVQYSYDLKEWHTPEGYPRTFSESFGEHDMSVFSSGAFFRVVKLDSEGPAIVDYSPKDGDYGVSFASKIVFVLDDPSGVDYESTIVTLEEIGSYGLDSSALSYEEGRYELDLGEVPLGTNGDLVMVSISSNDLGGNTSTLSYSFELVREPIVDERVFVFGSPVAQAMGQVFKPGSVASILAQKNRTGPVIFADVPDWSISEVGEGFLKISYTGEQPPIFEDGALLANSAPASTDEIFYRRVVSSANDEVNKVLTINTEDVALYDLVQNGSVSLSDDSYLLFEDNSGMTVQFLDLEVEGEVELSRFGFSLDGAEITATSEGIFADTGNEKTNYSDGQPFDVASVTLTLEELHCWFISKLQAKILIDNWQLEKLYVAAIGEVETAAIGTVRAEQGVSWKKTIYNLPEISEPHIWSFLGSIGPVPVWLKNGFDLKLNWQASLVAGVEIRAGGRQNFTCVIGMDYLKDREDPFQAVYDFVVHPTEFEPFEADFFGSASTTLGVETQLFSEVYGTLGVAMGVEPLSGVVLEKSGSDPFTARFEINADFFAKPSGPIVEKLGWQPEFRYPIFGPLSFRLFPNETELTILRHPQSQLLEEGKVARFSVQAESNDAIRYQWYQNGYRLLRKTDRTLKINNTRRDDLGIYHVEVSSGDISVNSNSARLEFGTNDGPVNEGLVGYWPLDGDVLDYSGFGKHGVNFGAAVTSDRNGTSGNAMYFSGDDWVELGTDKSIFGDEPLEITVCFWGMHEGKGSDETFIASYDSGRYDGYYLIGVVANNYGETVTSAFRTTVGSHVGGGNSAAVEKNIWNHYAVVFSREAQKSRFYVNGSFVSEADIVAGSDYLDGGRVFLGKSRFNGNEVWSPLHGSVDELRIYRRALEESEIATIAESK